jgi:hypothetical protein
MGHPSHTEDAIAERRTIVADLLVNGWNAPKIARHISMDPKTVYNDIAAVRAQWAENQTHSYQEWVTAELEALDHMESKIAHRIDTGDTNAIQARLRIMERRAKLVALDQPTRIVIDDGLTAEIRALAEQVGAIDNPAVRAVIGASDS